VNECRALGGRKACVLSVTLSRPADTAVAA
jgi:hypothetical protein